MVRRGGDRDVLFALAGVEGDVVEEHAHADACPLVNARQRVDWNIPDPKELPDSQFRAVRDLISMKVRMLLADVGAI